MTQKKKELPYLERDISWMYFNRRILQEAARPHVPLLERMAFLGIYSNNLDEFFRVRMATQNRIAECTDKSTSRESEHAKKLTSLTIISISLSSMTCKASIPFLAFSTW